MNRRSTLTFFSLILAILFLYPVAGNAQTFDGVWNCNYATIDDQPNSTGYNVPSLGVISEDMFVALVRRGTNSTCYLVGYSNADSINGRLGYYPYAPAGYRQQWSSGFDVVEMLEAVDIAATPDSLVYVANNDLSRNILVFKMSSDSVISTDYRLVTGADSIWAIDVDDNGYVYVTTVDITGGFGKVLVFKPIADDPEWVGLHLGLPITSITVPDPGELRGVTVHPSGSVIYVSNYQAKKVYCYIGDPASGYTQYTGFDYTYTDTTGVEFEAGPWGLGYMPEKNILFMAADVDFHTINGYRYGKIFLLNPNTGEELDTIDCAEWNFLQTGGYSNRPGGTFGTASGYASVYNVDFDENFNLYDQSYYGWTVDKWVYSGTLPTIPLTIVSVEQDKNIIPSEFNLNQNYPNPFNPTTTIEFAVNQNADISLKIYSITGELVTTLINSAAFEAGNYKLTFDASKLASATYIYVLNNGMQQLSKKMTLIK